MLAMGKLSESRQLMEVAVVCLAIACCLQAVTIAALAATVPFLWQRVQKGEADLAKLDEVVSEFLELSGVNNGRPK